MAKKRRKRAAKKPVKKKAKKQPKGNISQLIILAIGIIAVILLIYFAGDKEAPQPEPVGPELAIEQRDSYTIYEILEDIDSLDKEQVTEWKKERLGKYMVPDPVIDRYIEDLTTLKEWAKDSEDEKVALMIDTRVAMLESQKAFQKALDFGARGVVNEQSTCNNIETIQEATHYYNISLQKGHEFSNRLDKILRLADVVQEDVLEMIGVNTKKPRFYLSPFGDIYKVIAANAIAIETCANTESNDLYISAILDTT